MNPKVQTLKYIISDFLASLIAWALFFVFRKVYIEPKILGQIVLKLDYNFVYGIIIIPFFWLLLYYIAGYYSNVYRRSRLKELFLTFNITLLGVLLIFFVLILNDLIHSYTDYYTSLFALFLLQFTFIYIPRFFITSSVIKKIHNGKIGFSTLLIGSNGKTADIYNQIENMKRKPGNKFVGYVNVYDKDNPELKDKLKRLGKYENLAKIVEQYQIKEVIIAIESSEHTIIQDVLQKLILADVQIKIIPALYDLFSGYVNIETIYSTPLIAIQNRPLSYSQEHIKRMIDVFFSLFAIILLLPVYLIVAIGVKLSSKGPVFYLQERIGRYGKPFKIIKFRSMYVDAERNGPALSSKNDPRITPFGMFMRKTRLDEIPQFFNVLIGHMSLVGPRPERQYFIDQIVKKAPFYLNLLKVKPGITSLGQVKYGYAENVDQMIERMKYDLSYLQNISIYLDFKIMIMTIKTIFEASGK